MHVMYLLISFWSSLMAESNPTTFYFNVVRNGKMIGELKAMKVEKNDLIIYKSTTLVKTHILKDVDVLYEIEISMKNNQLYTSDAVTRVNEKTHDRTIVKWIADNYLIQRKGNGDRKNSEHIDFPEIFLLFQEPSGRTRTFSEKTGDFHVLHKIGKNTYEKVNPKGRKNRYYYQKGKLFKAEVDAGIVKFEIVKKNRLYH